MLHPLSHTLGVTRPGKRKTALLHVRLTPKEMRGLDEARGDLSRSAFTRTVLAVAVSAAGRRAVGDRSRPSEASHVGVQS